MTTKRNLLVRLVPCRCLRGEEETVTTLDYSHCSLEQVPKEIFTFEKTLEELYLDANQIEELPKQLFNCQSLHKLSLPDNDLTTLPASIANLINLRELDVSKNGKSLHLLHWSSLKANHHRLYKDTSKSVISGSYASNKL
ncbi:hypothetical protein ASZ78_015651 [Callipepla squamata]|uniref:Leucine-rich repeat-containing protein 7 n=1 Tax=Callipepla squamata TaxID=9009 RepID=A0A226N6T8_CALSU|nr:hypothetical protein ASZ78_015651 [Callipepla squamata]